MRVLINYDNDNLYCVECKEVIEIGEKYIIIEEEIYGDQIIEKPYHPDCVPLQDEDVYIGE